MIFCCSVDELVKRLKVSAPLFQGAIRTTKAVSLPPTCAAFGICRVEGRADFGEGKYAGSDPCVENKKLSATSYPSQNPFGPGLGRKLASQKLMSFRVLAGLLFVIRLPMPAQEPVKGLEPNPQILEKARGYCQRLGRIPLYFVCTEQVDEREYSPPLKILGTYPSARGRMRRQALVYDYQLIRSGGSVQEKRTLLRENGRACHEENSSLKTRIFKHKFMISGPDSLLSEYGQTHHRYKLLREEDVGKEKALLIEALPIGAPEVDLLYGKVWIRKKDCAILKIEWDQNCLGGLDRIASMAESLGGSVKPRISVICTYGIEKNGIRFPDRLTIEEDYQAWNGILRVSETTVLYKDYRFFTVETDVRFNQ
jgi:hypothetical protein